METQTALGFLSLSPSLLGARGLMRDAAARILWRGLTYTTTLQEDNPIYKGTFIPYLSLQTRIRSSGEDNNKKTRLPCQYFILKCFYYITFYQQAIGMCYYCFKIKLIRSWSFNILFPVGMDLFSGYFSPR